MRNQYTRHGTVNDGINSKNLYQKSYFLNITKFSIDPKFHQTRQLSHWCCKILDCQFGENTILEDI